MEKCDKMKISIVGCGFVGSAVAFGFEYKDNEIQLIDPKHNTSVSDVKDFQPDLTFVCVPTPTVKGRVDRTIVDAVTSELAEINSGITVVKSTMTPDIAEDVCGKHGFVYNPEFLTQDNAQYEFRNPQFHVLGGDFDKCKFVANAYINHSSVMPCKTFYMSIQEASMVKYAINSFLATKVVWFNQLRDLCQSCDLDYDYIKEVVGEDKRISKSHTKAPGFDHRRGFGGACFPKDTRALLTFAFDYVSHFSVLNEAVTYNNRHYRDNEYGET